MGSVKPWHRVGRFVIAAVAWLAWPVQQPAHSADSLDPQDAFKFSAAVADGGKAVDGPRGAGAAARALVAYRSLGAARSGRIASTRHDPPPFAAPPITESNLLRQHHRTLLRLVLMSFLPEPLDLIGGRWCIARRRSLYAIGVVAHLPLGV